MEYTLAAYTDAGVRKGNNQDSLCLRRARINDTNEVLMAVVCDGMGGLQKGEVASGTCVLAFANWFDRCLPQIPWLCENGLERIRDHWNELLQLVHQKLASYSASTGVSLGTTVAALFAYGNRFLIVNVGDTRVYGRRHQMQRLTQDHSLVAREVNLGLITEAEARTHPQCNVLLQCVGQGEVLSPSYVMGQLQGDMLFFLCTDGYTHTFSDEEMGATLNPLLLDTKESMLSAMTQLSDGCKEAGETDNITGVLIKVRENAVAAPKRSSRGLFGKSNDSEISVPNHDPILLETAEILHTSELI